MADQACKSIGSLDSKKVKQDNTDQSSPAGSEQAVKANK